MNTAPTTPALLLPGRLAEIKNLAARVGDRLATIEAVPAVAGPIEYLGLPALLTALPELFAALAGGPTVAGGPAPVLVLPDGFVPFTAEQRADLKRLVEAATKGSLEVGGTRHESAGDFVHVLTCETEVFPGPDCNEAGPLAIFGKPEDAAYFAAARPDVALGTLAYIEALEAHTASLLAALTTLSAEATELRARCSYLDGVVDRLNEENAELEARATTAEAEAAGLRTEMDNERLSRQYAVELLASAHWHGWLSLERMQRAEPTDPMVFPEHLDYEGKQDWAFGQFLTGKNLAATPLREEPAPAGIGGHLGCKCSFRTFMVGDGCEKCNPQLAADYAPGGKLADDGPDYTRDEPAAPSGVSGGGPAEEKGKDWPEAGQIWRLKKSPTDTVSIVGCDGWAVGFRRWPLPAASLKASQASFYKYRSKKLHYFTYEYELAPEQPSGPLLGNSKGQEGGQGA